MVKTLVMVILLTVAAAAAVGCNADTPPEEETGAIKIVESVPAELFHWFGHEMGQDRGARVFNNSHGDHTYYVATAGRQSVKGGEITILEKDMESDTWSIRLEYMYPGVTERSLDTHFLIFQVPLNQAVSISIAAATGVAQ